ncbi:hypothetical protein P8452_01753 [Trifolium repens]|nr:hypothetical protein P8452_01753 [Trifolium repens]
MGLQEILLCACVLIDHQSTTAGPFRHSRDSVPPLQNFRITKKRSVCGESCARRTANKISGSAIRRQEVSHEGF